MRKTFLLLILASISFLHASSQNCTVNAGTDTTACGSTITLRGSVSGTLDAAPNYLWTQISGPAATITTANALTTTVTGMTPGTYVFQFSAKCQSGETPVNTVNAIILPEPAQPLAGPDQQLCTQSSVNLSANTPPSGQTGQWVIVSGVTGITIANASNATTTATITTGGLKQVIWRISNGTCSKDDTLDIRVVRPATVNAGPDISASCTGTCVTMAGSDPGITPGLGLWELVSGPSTPVIANPNSRTTTVCNLITGTYTLKWTVSGPCSSASDLMVINVANTYPAPAVGNAVNYTAFCNTAGVSSLVLKAVSLQTGETGTWTSVSGPSTPTIATPNSSNTVVSGLNGSGIYSFRFTVANANCQASVLHNIYFQETLTGLSTPADQQLACDAISTTASLTYSGISNVTGLTRLATLVSGPVTSGVTTTRASSGSTDTWTLAGMTAPGKYVFRFEYRSGCGALFRDMAVYVSRAPSGSNAGTDQYLACAATGTALAGNNPGTGKGTWSQVSGPNTASLVNPAVTNPSVAGLVEGTYVFRWTITGGVTCAPKQDEVVVIKASAAVVPANAGTNMTVCPGAIVLSGNSPGPTQSGAWTVTPSTGISFSNVNDKNATITGLKASTAYTFTWTISNACSSSANAVVISANTNNLLTKPNAGTDLCLPSGTTSIPLAGNTAANTTYIWTALDGGSITDASQSTTTAVVPANGTYRYVYSGTAPGCTTLYDTVVYTVAASTSAANAGVDQAICATAVPVTTTLTATQPTSGTGVWNLTAGDASASITNPNSNTTSVTNLASGQYEFRYLISNGVCPATEDRMLVNIDTQPSTADAGPDITKCALVAASTVAMAAGTPANGTGNWTLTSGPPGTVPAIAAPTSPTSNFSGFTSGIYLLKWTVSTGLICPKSTDDVMVTVSRTADASTTVNAQCNVNSITLAGNPNTTGTWTNTSKPGGSPTVTITPTSGETAIAQNLARGAYVFQYTIPAVGSCAQTSSNRTVTLYDPPTVANGGPDISLCPGTSTATLVGNIPSSGTAAWTRLSGPATLPTAGSGNTTSYDTSLNGIDEGITIYRYTISNSGCAASNDTVSIIKEKPAAAGADQRVCNLSAVSLSANTPTVSTGLWTQVSGPGTATISPANSPAAFASGLTTGTYNFRWTIAAAGSCPETTDDMLVTVDPSIGAANAGPDITVCPGVGAQTLGSAAQSGITYAWSPGTYLTNTNMAQPNFTGTSAPGTYVYTLASSSGSCSAYDQVTVVVRPFPANFSYTQSAGNYIFTAIDAGAGSSYLWNFGNGATPQTASTIGPHTVTYTNAGSKTPSLTVTDGNACTSTKTVTFAVSAPLPLDLLQFSATVFEREVVLSWEVANSVNVRGFEIEKSGDGSRFSKTGMVAFVNNKSDYSFTDNSLPATAARAYYRLKIVDYDGKFAYSNIKQVAFGSTSASMAVSPNPFTNSVKVHLRLERNESSVEMQLLDSKGRESATRHLSGFSEGLQTLQMENLGFLPQGLYIVRVRTSGGRTMNAKVVKN